MKLPLFSVILPAKNEAENLDKLLPEITKLYPNAEVIVVNDGSNDNTIEICQRYQVKIITHPYSMGNGAAIKAGARVATNDIFVFMDADGQHQPEQISLLVQHLQQGYDMVVGARSIDGQASFARRLANGFYNRLSSWISNHEIKDLTSGFRAVNAKKFRQFLYLLPNGFSYPTTITMAFLRSGYPVMFIAIDVRKRQAGLSHIKPLKDGFRFFLIIFRIGTLYSPLKLFLPTSFVFFTLGSWHYLHTFITQGRFTNMSALLFITSILVFLIGLVSEQITTIIYSKEQ